ncbi:MAG: flagellar hook capping FlgD N-terminal domain-containing protein [Bacillota bacterium]
MNSIAGLSQTMSGQANEEAAQVEREDDNNLDKDAFFELLVTQMKHQDPLNPMDNTKFMSQMAQFSSLEQMNNMNESMGKFLEVQGLAEGSSLIGKTVEIINEDAEQSQTGEVTKVTFEEEETYAHLDDGTKALVDNIDAIY